MNPSTSTSKLPSAAYDNKIYAKFALGTIEKKVVNKEGFQKEFGLIPESKVLLLGFTLPLTEKNGASLLAEMLPGLEALGIQVALMGIGTEKYQRVITEFAQENESVAVLENNEFNVRKLYAACDAVLFLSDGEDTKTALEIAISYGVVPIASSATFGKKLSDYNPNQEKGNSFLFDHYDCWSAFSGVVRAVENFKFPYDWKNIAREAMQAGEK